MSTAIVTNSFFGDFGDHYRSSNGSTTLQNSKNGFGSPLDPKKSTLASVYNSVQQNNNNINNNINNNNINNINNNNIINTNNNTNNVMTRRLVTTTSSVPILSHSTHRLQTSPAVPTSAAMHQKTPIGVHNNTITQPPLQLVRGLSTTGTAHQCSQTNSIINANNNSKEHKKLDRSYSEPAEKTAQQLVRLNSASAAVAGPMSSRYKTELCRSFGEVGTCKYGDKCQFAHGGHELRVITRHPKFKTENCKSFHSTGFCPYGPRCHFIHNSEESKNNMLNNLNSTGSPNGNSPNGTKTNGSQNRIGEQIMNNININSNNSMVSTNAFGTTYHSNANSHPLRPKALSIGSYSLGSSGEVSPPSSQSGSPTSLNSFFTEDPFNPFVSPTHHVLGNCANNAFSFSPDFASLVSTNHSKSSGFGGSQPSLCPTFPLTPSQSADMSCDQSVMSSNIFSNQFQTSSANNMPYEQHMNEGTQGMATTPPPQPPKGTPVSYPMAPESPVGSITSDVEALKLEESSATGLEASSRSGVSPGASPTCSSPLELSKSLVRLPIFTRFANNGHNDSE